MPSPTNSDSIMEFKWPNSRPRHGPEAVRQGESDGKCRGADDMARRVPFLKRDRISPTREKPPVSAGGPRVISFPDRLATEQL